jgi:arylsulfatase A-like enzyme/Flp pilus assembly protein TadD
MRRFGLPGGIATSGLVLAGIFHLALTSGCSRPARSPNEFSVILVTLDTTRADRIGAFGGTAVPTPNLDRMAFEGVKFAQAISQVPLTLPAHASILTGRYPASHGVRHNGLYRLPESEQTLTERLKEAGFDTAAFIAAFVLNAGFGLDKGFDTYDDIRNDAAVGHHDRLYDAQRTADEVNAAVFEWLDKRQSDNRLFLWVHYYDPHMPYSPPETPGRTLHGQGYDREISYMDHCFGDLVEGLRERGLLDRSILYVVGDHGESLGEHREQTHGVFLYEGAVRVPKFIRAPGLLPKGREAQGPAELVDIAPTLLDLLGLPALERAQGSVLTPRIRGREEGARALAYAETLMPRIEYGWSELKMVRDSRFKYVRAPRPELYDLREDPKELSNLVDVESDLAAEMAGLLEAWIERTSRPDVDAAASRSLSPEEEAKLRSLGYLGGDFFTHSFDEQGNRPDPKDKIDEAVLLTQGRDRLAAGRLDEALAIATKVLDDNPNNHLARSTRIQALLHLRHLEDAEEEALAAVAAAELDPDASARLAERARRTLASVLWVRGKREEAEEQYRVALEMNRDTGGAPVVTGVLLGAAGGMEEARRLARLALERDSRDGAALGALFEMEMVAGNRTAALRIAEALADSRGAEVPALMKAGRALREAGNPVLAVLCFEAALRKAGPESPEILGFLGTARIAAGDLDGAEKALREVTRLRPEDPRAPFYLGNIALLKEDERRAKELYGRALELDPDFTPPLVNLARWQASKGRFDEAERTLVDALARNPEDSQARELLDGLPRLRAGASR